MKKHLCSFMNDQQGSIMLETMIVLSVLSMLILGAFKLWTEHQRQQQSHYIAEQVQQVMKAAESYIINRHKELAQQAYPHPYFVDMDKLQQEGWLSAAFVNRNPYNQKYGLLIRRLAEKELEALIITYEGEVMDILTGHTITVMIGAAGGFIENETSAIGAFGGWQLALANYQRAAVPLRPGHLAVLLFFNRGNLLTNYLHRYAVDGYPEANTMFTHIDMNKHNIDTVHKINVVKIEAGKEILEEPQFETINRLHPLRCSKNEALTRIADGTFQCVQTVPTGTIAAFTQQHCPVGWTNFNESAGRFFIAEGTLGIDSYALNTTGGEARVTLNINQIPPHSHSYPIGSGEKSGGSNVPAAAENYGGPTGSTHGAGGGQAHENRPPYYVVRYCIKD